jgi:hypothetical protein
VLNAFGKCMATIGPRFFALWAAAVLVLGCAGMHGPIVSGDAKFYAVTAEKAPFFRYGPQQGNGADLQLPKDTLMTVIRPSFGYCKVHLTSGEEGYVASEDIQVAPAALVAAITAPPPSPTHVGRDGGEERFNLESEDPRLVVPPEDLPEPTPLPGTTPY